MRAASGEERLVERGGAPESEGSARPRDERSIRFSKPSYAQHGAPTPSSCSQGHAPLYSAPGRLVPRIVWAQTAPGRQAGWLFCSSVPGQRRLSRPHSARTAIARPPNCRPFDANNNGGHPGGRDGCRKRASLPRRHLFVCARMLSLSRRAPKIASALRFAPAKRALHSYAPILSLEVIPYLVGDLGGWWWRRRSDVTTRCGAGKKFALEREPHSAAREERRVAPSLSLAASPPSQARSPPPFRAQHQAIHAQAPHELHTPVMYYYLA